MYQKINGIFASTVYSKQLHTMGSGSTNVDGGVRFVVQCGHSRLFNVRALFSVRFYGGEHQH